MQLLCCCILYAIGSNIKNIVSLDPSPAPYYFLLPHEF